MGLISYPIIMDITIFLAQIWGPVIFAVGIGVFTSRSYYLQIYRNLEKETLAVLCFGMFGMALGIIQINVHNVWGTFAQVIISFLGWALLAKATLFIVAPRFVDQSGDWAANLKLVPVSGILMLVCGAYLSWIGYLA